MSKPSKKLETENPRDCGRTPRWLVDVAASYCGGTFGLDAAADASNAVSEKLLQHGSGVVTYRLPIEGRFSCDPPPGITYSTPPRPMAVWILRRVIRAPKRARVKLAELGR